jgi:hypothetical protein
MVPDTRRITAGLLAGALLLAGGAQARAQDTEAGGVTPPRLSYLAGPVSFWRPGAEEWTAAEANVAVAPGDELHTGRHGNVELQIGPRAFVRAWGDTQLGVVDHGPELLRLRVTDGHVAVDARALDPGLVIQVQAPAATFAIDRSGYYRVDVEPDRTSFTTRRDGHATITRVVDGATETATAPGPDVWDRWNQGRTDHVLQAASTRYVPEGVYGAHDLDQHGDWRVVPTYGAVWVPRGAPVGWAPYTTGRWVWDPRYGWTWVDAAPWGWAPYHYGRWVHLDGLWAWAPGPVVARPVYAPALVAFFSAPGVRISIGAPFVSWVALGWGEPLVPWWGRPGFVGRPTWHGWGGPRVVNNVVVHRTTVVHAHDIRRYRNADVHRAVVAVRPDRFGRSRVQDSRVTEIDTRRLEPVRGPLRGVAEPARRAEPGAGAPRPTPRVTRDALPSAAPRPEPRRAAPPAADLAPEPRRVEPPSRPDPRPRAETPRREGSSRSVPGPEPRPRVEAPRPDTSPQGAAPRPDGRPREDVRPEPRPRLDAPRPEVRPRLDAPRPEVRPRAELPGPEARPRVELPRRQSPAPAERSRPEIRSGAGRPPRAAADRIAPGRGPRVEPRRAPGAPRSMNGGPPADRAKRGAGRQRPR